MATIQILERPTCPRCVRFKEWLTILIYHAKMQEFYPFTKNLSRIEFHYFDHLPDIQKSRIWDQAHSKGVRFLPIICIDGKVLGSYESFMQILVKQEYRSNI